MKSFQRIITLSLVLFLAIITRPAMAEEFSEFQEIHSSVLEDYSTYAFKFTNVGSQFKVIPTNGGYGPGRTFDVDDFKPLHRSAHDYGNDDGAVGSVISLSVQEFKAFVDAVGDNPDLQSIEDIDDPSVSLMIIRDFGLDTKCWEHLDTVYETRRLFDLLIYSIDPTRQDVRKSVWRCKQHMGGI